MRRLGIRSEVSGGKSKHLRDFSEVFSLQAFDFAVRIEQKPRDRLMRSDARFEDLSQSQKKVSEELWCGSGKGHSCQQKKLLTCSAGFF